MDSEQPPSENPMSPGDDNDGRESGTVWQRLREHLEQTCSGQSESIGEQQLAQRLTDRARALRQRMERPQVEGTQQTFVAFNKQHERYGIALNEVAAVETLEHFTPVPNAPAYIRGVIPWRGSILSLVDLGRLFGKPESGIADLRACIIIDTDGRRLAVVAHEVEEIISVSNEELVPLPDLPGDMAPEWVVGVHDQNRLILRMSEIVKAVGQRLHGVT